MVQVPNSNVSITIQCDGKDLPEYAHEVNGQAVTCCIPSVEGKAFHIHTSRPTHYDSLTVKVYLDGGPKSAFKFSLLRPRKDKEYTITAARVNKDLKRRLVFSQLRLTDDEEALPAPTSNIDINALGTIRVVMKHVGNIRKRPPRPFKSIDKGIVHSGTIHERAKKTGGHIVSLGEEISAPWVSTTGWRYDSLDLAPYEVKFRYAPYDVLRAREIIPSPPAPPLMTATSASLDSRATSSAAPPVKVKREREEVGDSSDRSGFSDEEEAAMYARLKAKKKAKRSKEAKVKTETNGIPAGIFQRGQIVDLTGDD